MWVGEARGRGGYGLTAHTSVHADLPSWRPVLWCCGDGGVVGTSSSSVNLDLNREEPTHMVEEERQGPGPVAVALCRETARQKHIYRPPVSACLCLCLYLCLYLYLYCEPPPPPQPPRTTESALSQRRRRRRAAWRARFVSCGIGVGGKRKRKRGKGGDGDG